MGTATQSITTWKRRRAGSTWDITRVMACIPTSRGSEPFRRAHVGCEPAGGGRARGVWIKSHSFTTEGGWETGRSGVFRSIWRERRRKTRLDAEEGVVEAKDE